MTAGFVIGIFLLIGIWAVFAAMIWLIRQSRMRKPDEQLHLHLTSPHAVRFVADDTGTIVAVGDNVENLLGYKPSDLIGKPIDEVIPEKYRARHHEAFQARLADPRYKEDATVLRDSHANHKVGGTIPVKIALRELQFQGKKRFIADISATDIFPQ